MSKSFDEMLEAFVKSQKSTMELALPLSIHALEFFAECGQVAYLQRFHDAMDKNYARRAAFVLWCKAFAPLNFASSVFTKDVSETAVALDLKGAKAKAFWEFSPATVVGDYTTFDIFDAVMKVFTRLAKMKPIDNAELELARWRKVANSMVSGNTRPVESEAVASRQAPPDTDYDDMADTTAEAAASEGMAEEGLPEPVAATA